MILKIFNESEHHGRATNREIFEILLNNYGEVFSTEKKSGFNH